MNSTDHDNTIETAFTFTRHALKVERWIIKSPSRKAFAVQARALVATILKSEGLTFEQIAAAVGLKSRSSAHELIERYRNRRDVLTAFGNYTKQKTETPDE